VCIFHDRYSALRCKVEGWSSFHSAIAAGEPWYQRGQTHQIKSKPIPYRPSLTVNSASCLLMSYMETTESSHVSLTASETLILLWIRTRAGGRKTLEYL
jgi:hypothetical protein